MLDYPGFYDFIIHFTRLEPSFPGIYMPILKHRIQAYGQLTSWDTLLPASTFENF